MPERAEVSINRELLVEAQGKGAFSSLAAFFRLSGPGWLQSAITLGGGSLGSALYLGVLGGTSMLWLNLIAIFVGVIMLSSISYVVLSSGQRPFRAINEHVNPVLGIGWVTATILANMIWVLPQFGLCFDILNKNLLPGTVHDTPLFKYGISAVMFIMASGLVFLNLSGGLAAKLFDWLLKLIVAAIVISFVAVVVSLFNQGQLEFGSILAGLIPRPDQWFAPVSSVDPLLAELPQRSREFWSSQLVTNQRNVMISTTATAVGINMTFLLPYSMLNRGWDRPFRALAVFDLITGLAIPFVLVTSCVVIASASSFHAQADQSFLSDDASVVATSPVFASAANSILNRMAKSDDRLQTEKLSPDEIAGLVAGTPVAERKLAAMLVRPNTGQLAKSLEPLLGERYANLVFGIGAFGMGFSTIIVLMMINGFAVAELFGMPQQKVLKMIGATIVGLIGAMWPLIWESDSKTWLIILASTFGAILLPIAYIAFFALMNNRDLLKDDMLTGGQRWAWNILMAFGVIAALAQAITSLYTKLYDPESGSLVELHPGSLIVGGVVTFALLTLIGFAATKHRAVQGKPE